ncbi:hypothetical protein COY95_01280 [Candidatus Woesearchaeota archaeon CG_4_10_14_0_8_um_filter_47_5]|nr:MAG: hypothetical protein COY95_01280 [Candidatus Woesearchaeota archaeon CG_4_10_14_0_8_um_filter_47_5]
MGLNVSTYINTSLIYGGCSWWILKNTMVRDINQWEVKRLTKSLPKLNNPFLIEGLPGIGNVGKITVDFIIEELDATPLYEFFSFSLPASVFVNDSNLVDLPKIRMYYKAFKNKRKRDVLILAGDVQPVDDISSYRFSEVILKIAEKFGAREIITLGGVGLSEIPDKPKVYCTGNMKSIVQRYKVQTNLKTRLYGTIGPIIGVSGILVGLSRRMKIPAVSLLAETYGHPMFLGVKGAREIVKVLNKKCALNINIRKMNGEIKRFEDHLAQNLAEELDEMPDPQAYEALLSGRKALSKDQNYIG